MNDNAKTDPPPADSIGFFEEFEDFFGVSLEQLEDVVAGGLEAVENETLIRVAAKLIRLAQVHDPEALSKVEALL